MAAKVAPRTENDLVLDKSRVYGKTQRAIFHSKKRTGLWYAETKIPDDKSAVDKNPYTWDTPPRKINLAMARPIYTKGTMTSAKYAKKQGLYSKQIDYLRYNTELFGNPYWIKDMMLREIDNCQMLRKYAHPNICRYIGVNYNINQAITSLLFKRYDMTLWDLVCDNHAFDADKCLQGIRKGIQHIHSLGYVHCDIKPQNIFVDLKARNFVIGDFDSMQEQGTPMDYKCGTPDWELEKTEKYGKRAHVEQDWFGFDIVSAWVKEKGNGKPVPGRLYPKTVDILRRAKTEYEVRQRAKVVQRQEEVKKKVAEKAKAIVDKAEAASKAIAAVKATPIPKADALEKIEVARKVNPTQANKAAKRTPSPKKDPGVPKKLRVQPPS